MLAELVDGYGNRTVGSGFVVIIAYTTLGFVVLLVLAFRNPSLKEDPRFALSRWTYLVWPVWLVLVLRRRRSERHGRWARD